MSMFFETISNFLGFNHHKATANHPPTSEQAERYNITLIMGLHSYVDEQQPKCYNYVQPLT